MSDKNLNRLPLWITILLIGTIGMISIWLNYHFVVEYLDYSGKDFATFWLGGKAIWHGLSPYDLSVWTTLPTEYGLWIPNPRALYPLWTFFLTVPFSWLPFSVSAALWLTIAEGSLFLTLYCMIKRVGKIRPSLLEITLLALGGGVSISSLLIIINGQISLLLLALLTLYLVLQNQKRFFLAGFVLAFILLKPNLFILFAPLVGLWLIQQKRWQTVGGSIVGASILLMASWIAQPGWIADWLNVRSRTAVTTTTPTLWGIAAELSPTWWVLLGIILVILVTGGLGWLVFTGNNLADTTVISLALTGSLLITPYIWAYEFVMLFIPWLWIFICLPNRKLAQISWILLTLIIPWLAFIVSSIRIKDSYGFVVPAITSGALVWWEMKERKQRDLL